MIANEASVLLINTLIQFLALYQLVLIVRILLTWFQTMEWANQIASFLSPITDPFLNLFRSFIPPLGGLDLSPMLAFFAIYILQQVLTQVGSAALSY
ncbi:YggT family protein [Oscillatoria sp. FACHB-1406]|uniref:YggT family protein n=1 Tax=Oscillatoria sp. FACHB-1406 TaxID=2692846 RepID=UPI00168835FD|nr:YggT family protein [Oscillatoria sp. FACHB-1406]MBD2578537.1 YggT family protein [Oscillatoria sp. FACHB-1406]